MKRPARCAGLPTGIHLQETCDPFAREPFAEVRARLGVGHASIATAQRHLHLDDQELADAQVFVE